MYVEDQLALHIYDRTLMCDITDGLIESTSILLDADIHQFQDTWRHLRLYLIKMIRAKNCQYRASEKKPRVLIR